MQRLRNNAKWSLEYDSQCIALHSSILICSLNTRNVHMHINDKLSDHDTNNCDILCLQETYILESIPYELFPGFNCIPNYANHGMLTCFKKHISILEYAHHEEENVELTIADVISKGAHLTILNIYASPNATLDNITTTLTKALCNIQLNQRILILGNFNIDLSKMNTKTKALENYMHSHNFIQMHI